MHRLYGRPRLLESADVVVDDALDFVFDWVDIPVQRVPNTQATHARLKVALAFEWLELAEWVGTVRHGHEIAQYRRAVHGPVYRTHMQQRGHRERRDPLRNAVVRRLPAHHATRRRRHTHRTTRTTP